jgi:hypothetical protein
MNEFTFTQLKIIVERAVRPVRANSCRKRKMREELLAHAVGVFEEEATLGDEPAALARTQERFGQAAELTRRLQESVPGIDRVFAETSGESALPMAASIAGLVGAAGFVVLGSAIPFQVLRGHGSEWLTVTRVPALLAPMWMASLFFCGTLLTHAMRQALLGLAGLSWLRASLVAAAAWLMVPVMTFPVFLAVTADIQTSLWDVVPLLPYGVLVPVVLVAMAYLVDFECRHGREWVLLDIN